MGAEKGDTIEFEYSEYSDCDGYGWGERRAGDEAMMQDGCWNPLISGAELDFK